MEGNMDELDMSSNHSQGLQFMMAFLHFPSPSSLSSNIRYKKTSLRQFSLLCNGIMTNGYNESISTLPLSVSVPHIHTCVGMCTRTQRQIP